CTSSGYISAGGLRVYGSYVARMLLRDEVPPSKAKSVSRDSTSGPESVMCSQPTEEEPYAGAGAAGSGGGDDRGVGGNMRAGGHVGGPAHPGPRAGAPSAAAGDPAAAPGAAPAEGRRPGDVEAGRAGRSEGDRGPGCAEGRAERQVGRQ